MKIIITKEDLDQIGRAVEDGCATGPIFDQFTMDLWSKIRLCIELGLPLEYQEEYTESEESMAVDMVTHVNGVKVVRR